MRSRYVDSQTLQYLESTLDSSNVGFLLISVVFLFTDRKDRF